MRLESLKESNDFLNILFNSLTSAVFVVDESIRIQSFNDSFTALFGRDAEELMGEFCGNALGCSFIAGTGENCGESLNCKDCALRQSIMGSFLKKVPADRQLLERVFHLKNGAGKKYFLFSTRYVHFQGEKMVLIIVDDVTELEEARRVLEKNNMELKQLHEQKNVFLGMASHDLRNPISTIWTVADFLAGELEERLGPVEEKLLKMIGERSRFALGLLNDLLDISKIEHGKFTLKKEAIDYVGLLRRTVEFNQHLAKQKGISIRLNSHRKQLIIALDESKIEQVLNNLISNAVKYSPSGTEVLVKLKDDSSKVCTLVRDQGIGIEKEEVEKIFTPFYQSKNKPTGEEKSTGLGLSIVKKIIEGHGGTLELRSEVGKGSEFFYCLPLQEA